MALIGAWMRREIHRRWRSLAVLALLVALADAVVFAAAAGARRGYTAIERLERVTVPATVQVEPYTAGFDWDAVRALPEVAGLTTYANSAFAIEEVANPYAAGSPAADPGAMRVVERPVVLAGRLADPRRPNEATVTAGFVRLYGLGVGDTVTAHLYSTDQARQVRAGAHAPSNPAGPEVRLRIVGVVRSIWYSDAEGFEGNLQASPALVVRYPENILGTPTVPAGSLGALVRLRGGDADLPAFQSHLSAIAGRRDVTVRALSEFAQARRQATTYEGLWLLAFAAAAAAASVLLVGQTLARHVASTVRELSVLTTVGMTPAQLVRTAAAAPALAVATGTLVGTAVAALASRWFPIGTAADVEPEPGFAFDPLVLGLGPLAVLTAGVGIAATSAALARTPRRADASPRPSSVVVAAVRAGMPLVTVVGARFALEAGRGRTSASSRSALIGAAAGVTGVVAALTLAAAVDEAAANPARFGQTWGLMAVVGQGGQAVPAADRVLAAAASDPDVTGVDDGRVGVAQLGDGALSTTLFSPAPVGRPLDVVTTRGRAPTSGEEILLGPETATVAGVDVGARVLVAGTRDTPATMTVSGIGFVPMWVDSSYYKGGWVTGAGFDALFTGYDVRVGLLSTRAGADLAAVRDRLGARLRGLTGTREVSVEPADRLFAQDEVIRISRLPSLLGAFLGLLAVTAVGHALITTARRRRHDLAVLRALGMTRGQVRWVLHTQSSLLALAGLVVGVPLGVALGRTVWRVVAGFMPLQYAPPDVAVALALVVPASVLVANVVAAWPARLAGRMRVGYVLRAE
jgi:hypothetical protein